MIRKVPDCAAQDAPHSVETETAVLSVWSFSEAFGRAWEPLPDLFFDPTHRAIAAAMAKLPREARDQASILAQLDADGSLERCGGAGAVYRILTGAPSCSDPWPHVRRLHELRALREAIRIVRAAVADATTSKSLGGFVAQLQDGARAASTEVGTEFYSPADLMRVVARSFQERESARWFKTGIPTLDNDMGGLQAGHVSVLAAGTNFGKSAIALMLADRMLADGHRPLILSFEDSPLLYGRRLMARRANVSPTTLRRPERIPNDSPVWSRVMTAAGHAEREKFLMNCTGKSIELVSTDLRCILASENIDCVLLDYLQAVQCSKQQQDRRNEVAYVARTFCDTVKSARNGAVAGVMLSQLRRLPDGTKPSKHDIKEAGDVENMAENVVVGWVSESGAHMLSIEKAKDGLAGSEFGLRWNQESCSFDGEILDEE